MIKENKIQYILHVVQNLRKFMMQTISIIAFFEKCLISPLN